MTACSQSSVLRPFIHLFVQHILSVRHGPGLPLLLAHGGWRHTTLLSTFRSSFRIAQEAFIVSAGDIFYLGCRKGSGCPAGDMMGKKLWSPVDWNGAHPEGMAWLNALPHASLWKTVLDGLRRKGDTA